MKKKYLILLCFIVFNCQNSNTLSFHSLNNAFITWYYKFHPVESIKYSQENSYNSFRKIDVMKNKEYIADVSRFLVELSQIDHTKLTASDRIDYQVLYSKLEQIQHTINHIRSWEWDPLLVLNEIYESLFLISESPSINMKDRVETALDHLKRLPKMLISSKKVMIYYSYEHHKYANMIINNIIEIIDQLPVKLNSDNITLDSIDQLIKQSRLSLVEYREWLDQKYIKLPKIDFPVELKLIEKSFQYYIGKKYISNDVYDLAEKNKILYLKSLFDTSIPLYLSENDEPIWLDRGDTIDVIDWTINHILNISENKVINSSVLSQFYESVSYLEKAIEEKQLFSQNITNRIKLDFAFSYAQLENFVYVLDTYQKDINSEIIYYIYNDEDPSNIFPLTKQEIYILNSKNLIPGSIIQQTYAQKYASDISWLFPDPINKAGWNLYAVELIVDEYLSNIDIAYKILLLKEQIKIICWGIVEEKYYSGYLNRKEAVEYLMKEAFINHDTAEALIIKSDKYYFSGTQSFIGMLEMSAIKDQYIQNKKETFKIQNFHQDILQYGIIPFNELKKIVFPQ